MKETAGPKTGIWVDWDDVHRRLEVTRRTIEEIRLRARKRKRGS